MCPCWGCSYCSLAPGAPCYQPREPHQSSCELRAQHPCEPKSSCGRAQKTSFPNTTARGTGKKEQSLLWLRVPATKQQQQRAQPSPGATGWGRTHALLVQALPPDEHLHVLVEGEGPVVLAEAVQQLGILVVRVLVAHWKEEGRAGR